MMLLSSLYRRQQRLSQPPAFMNPTGAKILRRFVFVALLLLAIIVALASVFLSQLELDDYRHELEQGLSSSLGQPVQIGRSKLMFHKGIALRFQDLRIGPAEAPFAEVPHITATLRIAPLFKGQIILNQVEVDSPSLQIWLPILKQPEQGATNRLSAQFGIRTLTIRDARLKVHLRQETGSRLLLSLDNLQTELRGWQPNQTTKLVISGQLQQPQQPADFTFTFNLPSSPDPAVWRNEELNYQLSIDNLALNPLTATNQQQPTSVNLRASIKGIPAEGARINATLNNGSGGDPLFELAGRWTSAAEQETINKLGGQLLGLPLNGEFYLLRQEKIQLLAGRFGAANVKLTRQLLKRWRLLGTDKLLGGNLESLALVMEKSWPPDQPINGWPQIAAELTLADLEWEGDSRRRLQDFSAELSLEKQRLEIRNGLLTVARQPIFFSGQISKLFSEPQLGLKLNLQPQLAELFPPDELPTGWKLSGTLPATLRLDGPLQRPGFQLQADLSATSLALGAVLQKQATQKSNLLIAGVVDSEQVQLEQLDLQLPGLIITGSGHFSHIPDDNSFLLDIDPINLARLQPLSPLLKKLRLQGMLQPVLERNENGLQSSLQLMNVGAHLNNIVGDLNHTSGTVYLDQHGLRFQKLAATLGKSDFILNGELDGWKTARLDLDLQSKKVRAQDLIFLNQQLYLYDLNGQLQIDRHGLTFDPVKVRLEQDTQVVVTGTVANFSDPQVTLDIQAEKANIDQVIELFVGPEKIHASKETRDHKPLVITAKVKQGTIGDLRFQNAEGLIKDHHGVLTVYPLHFQSGAGFCLARIEFDRNPKDGLLKISGHAEDLDASVLHLDLFKKRGLISGRLRGDFYLEGSLAGDKFWHNAAGGIHLQVKDGTLRKFRGLARVFSLLNVSQLFAGKLPDMDREGMPFTLLEGSVQIADGRAKTEDLRIISEAMNMSLVGSQSLIEDSLNYNLGVMPLRTVDKVISSIPIAGWILAGESKALLTAHFKIEGSSEAPDVTAIPISTVSDTVFGIFKRTLGLPGKLVKDLGSLFKNQPKKKEEPTE